MKLWDRPNSSAWSSPPSPPTSTTPYSPSRSPREEEQRCALADFLNSWGTAPRNLLTPPGHAWCSSPKPHTRCRPAGPPTQQAANTLDIESCQICGPETGLQPLE
ncbi:hypothetical protein [Streptomyces sp. NPDC058092]|uniref:hypothetical protein n=1 Tax=Streptomyces sp. NPDC058092 TaxID=3346336 RepID=UPI0036EEE93A